MEQLWIKNQIIFIFNNVDKKVILLGTYPHLFLCLKFDKTSGLAVLNISTAPTTITTIKYIYYFI